VDSGTATLMPGVRFTRSHTASRRVRNSSSIARTGSCVPVSAAMPAHWTKWVVHDSSFVLRVPMIGAICAGATAQPRREPVIAYFLLNV
jgi:hypothetical protein